MTSTSPSLYCASPLGFTPAGRLFLETTLHPLIESSGFLLHDPWTGAETISHPIGSAEWNSEVGRLNREMIDAADILLAVLEGVDVDSGTASEIGYAMARGKPVLGYREDLRQSGENSNAPVNLQVLYFINASNGAVAFSLEDVQNMLINWRDTKSFITRNSK